MPKVISNNKGGWLCSGYKVFQDGSKCLGCVDCDFGKLTKSIQQVFNDNHTILKIPVRRKKPKKF